MRAPVVGHSDTLWGGGGVPWRGSFTLRSLALVRHAPSATEQVSFPPVPLWLVGALETATTAARCRRPPRRCAPARSRGVGRPAASSRPSEGRDCEGRGGQQRVVREGGGGNGRESPSCAHAWERSYLPPRLGLLAGWATPAAPPTLRRPLGGVFLYTSPSSTLSVPGGSRHAAYPLAITRQPL